MNWPVFELDELFDIARGGSPRPIDEYITDDPDGVNWIMIGDTVKGSKYISATKKRIRKEGVSRSRMVRPGDFLLTNSMSFGRPYILDTPGCIHDGWLVLSPRRGDIDSNYFYHLLGSPTMYGEFKRLAAGAVVKNLNIDQVKGVKVPLPPLDEQRRIAAVLDKADAIRRKRQVTIGMVDRFLEASFREMFGGPSNNLAVWTRKPIGDLILTIEAGWSANGEPRARTDDEFGVLKISAVTSGRFKATEHKAVRVTDIDRILITPRRGDLLFSRANTRELVAATCLVERDEPRLFLPDKLWRIETMPDTVTPEYLRYLLSHPRFRESLTSQATGTSGSMLNISKEKLRSTLAPIPPLELQKQFSALVWTTYKLRAKIEDGRRNGELVASALSHKAFGGQIALDSRLEKLYDLA